MDRFPSRGAAVVMTVLALVVAACHPGAQVRRPENAGGLVFAVNPPDAEVFLDGVGIGRASEFTGDRYLEVARGTHRLEFRLAGYETYVRDVYVSNALLRIEATLLPRADAPGDS